MSAEKRIGLLMIVAALVAAGVFIAVDSGRSKTPAAGSLSAAEHVAHAKSPAATVTARRSVPALLVSVPAQTTAGWTTVARVQGQPAAWLAQRGGVTLLRFDQALVHVDLHAGSSDGG